MGCGALQGVWFQHLPLPRALSKWFLGNFGKQHPSYFIVIAVMQRKVLISVRSQAKTYDHGPRLYTPFQCW
jgi:hypothetical protein